MKTAWLHWQYQTFKNEFYNGLDPLLLWVACFVPLSLFWHQISECHPSLASCLLKSPWYPPLIPIIPQPQLLLLALALPSICLK